MLYTRQIPAPWPSEHVSSVLVVLLESGMLQSLYVIFEGKQNNS